MATNKNSDTEVSQAPADAHGVEGAPQDQANIKGAVNLGQPSDKDRQVAGGRTDGPILTADPSHEADKTSLPGPSYPPAEDPPVRTTRPDVPIVVALASGAGQHVPPDPDKYTPEGRPRGLPGSD
jgi:hypothetical protein